MLNTARYISSFRVLDSVASYSDHDTYNLGDVLNWVWDVISYLNIPMVYLDTSVEIDIENYRGALPQNFHKEIQVRELYSKKPLIKATNLFFNSPNKEDVLEVVPHINLEGDTGFITTDAQSAHNFYTEYSYNIKDGWLYTEFQTGTVEMMYKAFPVDEQGFPLIPEDAKLIRAIKAYIIKTLDYKAWRKGLLSREIYADSEQEYYFAAASAQSHANMPDLAMMENIRRFSSLLVSDPNQYSKSFKFLNS